MTDLDAFLPNIRMYAPGVADPTAYFAIRQAAIEFCERTRFWRYDDQFNVIADDCEGLLAPQDAVVHEVDGVWFDGQKLRPVTPAWLDEQLPQWRTPSELTGTPGYVTQLLPDTIRLVPYGAGQVKLSLILKPAQDAEQLPDFLAEQQRETIAWGALARILLIPNQSFTNPDMGTAFGQAFQQRLDGKATLGSTGQQRAPVRARASFL